MGFYEDHILPHLVNCACRQSPMARQREKIVPEASGRVLEIGIGTGLNLPFYDETKIEHLTGIDPSAKSWSLAQKNQKPPSFEVSFLEGSAEELPLDAKSVDTVVVTYSLCTIPDAVKALKEMRRVLKSDGQILFCEHGEAPDESVRKWQARLDPIWGWFGGGCHLNRPIPALFEEADLRLHELHTMYLPGPKWASFNYWGAAS